MTSKATQTKTCTRCNGKGSLNGYSHIRNGICFKCAGTGKVATRKTRKPTAASIAKQEARKAKAAARTAKIEMAMADDRVWNSPRMTVTKEHSNARNIALEVYEYSEKYGWNN